MVRWWLAVVVMMVVATAARGRAPNVVFILADDLGWRDTSVYGSTFYKTPNIDALAARGVRFTNAYAANPLCSPTRSSILTGLWPARIGITAPVCHVPQVQLEETLPEKGPPTRKALAANSATRLKTEYYTLAEAFKDAGYVTGHFGKWHLGAEPYDPLHQGFDSDIPHWSGPGPAGSYVAPWKFPPALKFTGAEGEHIEDRMASEATKFIKANKDRPFFLNYWSFSVHAPFDAKKELIEKHRKSMDPNNPQHNPLYAAMVESLDDAVGTLVRALKEEGLLEQTIIVFTSDNGGVHWTAFKEHGASGEFKDIPVTSNAPLRGGKATIYEGGTREPLIVYWPGVTKQGVTSDAVVQSIDYFPTFVEMLGLKTPAGHQFDGTSIAGALRGGTIEREAIYCHFPHYIPATDAVPSAYVRQGDWKLVRNFADADDQSDRLELYNLKEDIGEKTNLADKEPELAKKLNEKLGTWLKQSGAVVPVKNPAYRKSFKDNDWEASGTATVEVKDHRLIMTSTGKDPQIVAQGMDLGKGPLVVQMRMASDGKGEGMLFWSGGPKPAFARTARLTFDVTHDGAMHDYSVQIPAAEAPIRHLRIDPSMSEGKVTFEKIIVKKADGTVLKEWTF